MGMAAAGTQAVGAGVGAYGAYQSGLAQDRYYRYLATSDIQAADQSRKEGQVESGEAQNQGAFETEQEKRKESETQGAQVAAEAANGVSGSVTAADIATDTARKSALDRMAIRYNADRASYQAQYNAATRAWQLERDAAENETAATASKQAGKIGVFNSLLSGASQVGNTFYKNRTTAPSGGG